MQILGRDLKIDLSEAALNAVRRVDDSLVAAKILVASYAERASEEALRRCLRCERAHDTTGAFFWHGVYADIKAVSMRC
jgi:hypothetical protein